jgi:hypothetical protein
MQVITMRDIILLVQIRSFNVKVYNFSMYENEVLYAKM